ncbi:family 43 glycosylhydrolase [Mesobacillus foraminis]|uniref:glycoside hydrolase family 43 protein n=1 Tax=Mesobacillus foraminis TaxID=279826 RepID=UPI001BEB0EEC|nr:glycoside hydrolase family 43 protein [Mesobacillus foraminis]MBT2758863.1 family 43 glycosylhydrolase [Mesobacillus foraminis]
MSRKRLKDIHLRDPFILADDDSKKYYLYGSIGQNVWEGKAIGFDVYISEDLETWEGPLPAFRPSPEFWAERHFWAPEVYCLNSRYYMFASFKADHAGRATGVLVSDHPAGPFKPYVRALTPENWECLDGTLYIEDGKPWMVFCREWVEVKDGEMYAVRLLPDLSGPAGEPVLLFKASESKWAEGVGEGNENYVTDGPFLHVLKNGDLAMLWSTIGKSGYTMGLARSASGSVEGPWVQDQNPLFSENGGHGMLFTTFEGDLMLTIHKPNQHPNERPVIFKAFEKDQNLRIYMQGKEEKTC